MKPTIFDVWVNGNKLETTASAPEFQKEIEDTYIGMDFKTFSGIVHSNPNNSISLLNTKKEQKRAFLERLFNLESYSQLGRVINDKLRNLNESIIISDNDLRHKREFKESYEQQLIVAKEELESIDSKELLDQSDVIYAELERLKLNPVYTYDIEVLEHDLIDIKGDISLYDIEKEGYKTKASELYIEKRSLDDRKKSIGDLTDKREKINKAIERISELEKIDFDSRIYGLNLEIEQTKKQLDELEEYRIKNSEELAQIRVETSNLPAVDDLKGKPSCPTCGQIVDYKSISEDIDNKKKDLLYRKTLCDEKTVQLIENIKINKSNEIVFNISISELNDKKNVLDKLKITVESIDLDSVEKELDIIKKRLVILKNEEIVIDDKIKIIEYNQYALSDKKNYIILQIKEFNLLMTDIDVTNRNISLIKEKLKIHEHNKERFQIRVNDIKSILDKTSDEIVKLEKSYNKSIIIKDYLSYIKLSLKDENVKQFAISSILPYLNRQTNHYLSETGHSFYLLIDGWMEAEIRGIGMDDCSFANLSGGESKSIDLAIKFACIDIAKLMNTASTNILILDEILDSSIDSYGIQQLVDIVSFKQKEDNLAVYVVSHREEIGELEFDSIIKIVKEDGYSRIETN